MTKYAHAWCTPTWPIGNPPTLPPRLLQRVYILTAADWTGNIFIATNSTSIMEKSPHCVALFLYFSGPFLTEMKFYKTFSLVSVLFRGFPKPLLKCNVNMFIVLDTNTSHERWTRFVLVSNALVLEMNCVKNPCSNFTHTHARTHAQLHVVTSDFQTELISR